MHNRVITTNRQTNRAGPPARCAEGGDVATMRAAQIRAELKERRVPYDQCFDKECLVDLLVRARAAPPAPAPAPSAPAPSPPPPAQAPPPPSTAPPELDPYLLQEINAMRASQIREELKERRIGFGDCFDKEGLVERLAQARCGLVSPPPPAPAPSMRGAAKGSFEFGTESRQGEDMDLEEAFRQAGWVPGQDKKDPNQVDTARSPGMARDFTQVDQSDFKKPFSGGGRKGRYDR